MPKRQSTAAQRARQAQKDSPATPYTALLRAARQVGRPGRPDAALLVFAGGWQVELTDWTVWSADIGWNENASVNLRGVLAHSVETPPHQSGRLVRAELPGAIPPFEVTRALVILQRSRLTDDTDELRAVWPYRSHDPYTPPAPGSPLCPSCRRGVADAGRPCDLCVKDSEIAAEVRANSELLGADPTAWTVLP